MVLLRPTRPSRTNTKKDVLFIIGDWNAKVGSQAILWVAGLGRTKWSRAKDNGVLSRERTSHSKHPLPTKEETPLHMDITRWSIPKSDWSYSLQLNMEKHYTFNKTSPWIDCGSDHELLMTKFRLKLKKVGKTSRPFKVKWSESHSVMSDSSQPHWL